MRRNPILSSLLSLFIPGLGQMYAGQSVRGAAIMIAVIVVGNLNAIWLSAYVISLDAAANHGFWTHLLPRVLHDLFAFYGVLFLIWQIVDAYILVKNQNKLRGGAL